MLYLIVIVVVLILIVLVYVAKTVQARKRQYQANHSTDLPRTTQDIGEPVTFRGTANEVTDRVFGPRRAEYDRDGHAYDSSSSAFPSWMGGYGHGGRGVQRLDDDEEGVRDPDLPRYGETRGTTAIKAPERAYNPNAPPRTSSSTTSGNETNTHTAATSVTRDAPPQYDRAISTPAVTAAPPVVSTA